MLSQRLATGSGIICDFGTSFREFFDPVVDRITLQTLHIVNITLRIFFTLSPLAHENHNGTLLFGIILREHDRHFDY
jgi:hypothetical protein